MANGVNTSGRFAADVGYTKRPKKPKRPLAGEPRRVAGGSTAPKRKRERKHVPPKR